MLNELATWALRDGNLLEAGDPESKHALQDDLVNALDWETRDYWRDEYLSIIRDGLRLFCEARLTLGDARLIPQHVFAEASDVPLWNTQRALRFVTVVNRRKLDSRGCKLDRIEDIVLTAKLAASFIALSCRVLGKDFTTEVTFRERMLRLLEAGTPVGLFEMPPDPIRPMDISCLDTGERLSEAVPILHVKDKVSEALSRKSKGKGLLEIWHEYSVLEKQTL